MESKPERVLCFNVLLDESRRDVGVFRHPLYSYSEELSWPPPNWQDICCWHCCHHCPQEPVPLPQSCDRKTGHFAVFGLFCSWSCAKQYQNEHQTWTSGERILLLEDMAREAFGYKGPPIQAAPPRHRLKMFGGDLPIDLFREEHTYSNATLRPPLLSFPEVYERISSAGCEGDTAPAQWSVRGLRPKTHYGGGLAESPGAPPAMGGGNLASASFLSPFDKFVSQRQSSATLTPAPAVTPAAPASSRAPMMAPSSASSGCKRPASDADDGTLQRYLKKGPL